MERDVRLSAQEAREGAKVGAQLLIPKTHLEVSACTRILAEQALTEAFGEGLYELEEPQSPGHIQRCILNIPSFGFSAGVECFSTLAKKVDEFIS